jgi:hypothetical protein
MGEIIARGWEFNVNEAIKRSSLLDKIEQMCYFNGILFQSKIKVA